MDARQQIREEESMARSENFDIPPPPPLTRSTRSRRIRTLVENENLRNNVLNAPFTHTNTSSTSSSSSSSNYNAPEIKSNNNISTNFNNSNEYKISYSVNTNTYDNVPYKYETSSEREKLWLRKDNTTENRLSIDEIIDGAKKGTQKSTTLNLVTFDGREPWFYEFVEIKHDESYESLITACNKYAGWALSIAQAIEEVDCSNASIYKAREQINILLDVLERYKEENRMLYIKVLSKSHRIKRLLTDAPCIVSQVRKHQNSQKKYRIKLTRMNL